MPYKVYKVNINEEALEIMLIKYDSCKNQRLPNMTATTTVGKNLAWNMF